MPLHNSRYECVVCGTAFEFPIARDPVVVIKADGGSPNVRTIVFEGREIHRCPIGQADRTASR